MCRIICIITLVIAVLGDNSSWAIASGLFAIGAEIAEYKGKSFVMTQRQSQE